MSIPPIGPNQPSDNNEHFSSNGISQLSGHKISIEHLEDAEKTSLSWASSEHHFESEEIKKDMRGIDSFVANNQLHEPEIQASKESVDEEDFNFSEDESEDDVIGSYESGSQFESEAIKQESVAIKQESVAIKQESVAIKREFEGIEQVSGAMAEKTETMAEKAEATVHLNAEAEQLGHHLEERLGVSGVEYTNKSLFNSDVNDLQNKISSKPENKDQYISDFIDDAIDGGKIGRRVNGIFVPLSQQEKEKLRGELKSFFDDYFVRFPVSTKSEEKPIEKDDSDSHVTTFTKDSGNYKVAVYTRDRPIFSDNWQVGVILKAEILCRSILLDIINKKRKEEAQEKRESEQLDQLIKIIFAYILKTQILKNEIKIQNIKFEINTTINQPLSALVKLIHIINNSNKSHIETFSMQLPGLHKMTPLAIKAAT